MTIRGVDSQVDIATVEEQPKKGLTGQNNTGEIGAACSNSAENGAHLKQLQDQFLRSRKSVGSAMVQQQLMENLSLPIPLPLPRIPTPVGMIDFTKLVSVLGLALANGLKSFGTLGLGFARSVAGALGGAARTIKNATSDFGDLVKGNVEQIGSSVDGFLQDTAGALDQIEAAAGLLATSTDATAERIGADANQFLQNTRDEISRLDGSLQDFAVASALAVKNAGGGVELFAKGLLKVLSGNGTGIEDIRAGQSQIMRALDDAAAAGEVFASASAKSLQAIEQAASQFASATEGELENLGIVDRLFVESILNSAATISAGATDLLNSTAEATAAIADGTAALGDTLGKTIDDAWSKVAAAAEKFSRSISGTRETTKEFINDTSDFRSVVARARSGDPGAQAELKARWGYTTETLPPPGTQFIDPNFLAGDLVNGQVTSQKFPVGQAATAAPEINEQLFGNGRSINIPDGNGGTVVISNMAEYQQFVAKQRGDVLGLQNNSGDPVQVHVAFEGGGGQGKRYLPAISEMYRLGIVPSSATGTSVGAIAAALVAAGADPKQVETIVRDDRIAQFLDPHVGGRGGVAQGQVAYQFFDEALRNLTGIHDRPVTFADLKIPLHIVAAKYSDSDPPAGQTDLSQWQNRIFVFGPETTPNTPVALAVRASIAIPGVFDPVEMVDPTTGRTVELTDGGSLDNLPIGYNHDGLPTVALNLNEPDTNHPQAIENNLPTRPLPAGQLHASNPLLNGLYGALFIAEGGGLARDYKERTDPPANTFVLNLPTWDLEKPDLADDASTFTYDPVEDPRLDVQTRGVTDDFFRDFFGKLQESGASGTNLKPLPEDTSFTRSFEFNGQQWTARYDGGQSVTLTADDGTERTLFIGRRRLENWILDDEAFGDLGARLRLALEGSLA